MFEFIMLVILVIIASLIIIVVMMQKGASSGASGALVGGDLNLFKDQKERGADKIISLLTFSFVTLFITLALALRLS